MMTKSTIVAGILLSLAIGFGPAWAEDPPAAAPAAKTQTSTTQTSAEKKAISKACSDQANAKGLHGKARKKFRAECKAKGGKME